MLMIVFVVNVIFYVTSGKGVETESPESGVLARSRVSLESPSKGRLRAL